MSSRLKRWSRGVMFTVAMGGVCAPASVSAQSSLGDTLDEAFSITTSYAVVTGVVAALAVMIPLGITTSIAGNTMNTKNASMERYLRENASDVREALVMGEGPVVEDMAKALGLGRVEHVALGRLLRRERAVFGELAEPALLTPERAGMFVSHLVASMAADPALAGALARGASGG